MKAIKKRREALHMTQMELAQAAGVTHVSIIRYEQGMRIPNVEIAGRIAAALGCTVDDLLRPDKEPA